MEVTGQTFPFRESHLDGSCRADKLQSFPEDVYQFTVSVASSLLATTDSDGKFTIKGLPEGNVTLRVWAGNKYQRFSMEIQSGTQGVRAVLTAK